MSPQQLSANGNNSPRSCSAAMSLRSWIEGESMPKTEEEWIAFAGCLVILSVLFVLGGRVVRDTMRKRGRWGVNVKGLAGMDCPECGEALPAVRKPQNLNQTLW